MGLRFTTLRGLVLGLICILSIASVILSWKLYSFLTNRSSLIVVTAIPVLTALGISTSLLCRVLSKTFQLDIMSKQTIIWEVIWSVGLVPFNIVVCSIALFIQPSSDTPDYVRQLFNATKAVFISNAILLTIYASTIYALTLSMYYTIDSEVWTRDVYGDPGPFAFRDFIAYWRGRHEREVGGIAALRMGVRSPNMGIAHFCVPGSGCCEAQKPQSRAFSESTQEDVHTGVRPPRYGRTESVNSMISVPSVTERRSQIIVLFEEVGRE